MKDEWSQLSARGCYSNIIAMIGEDNPRQLDQVQTEIEQLESCPRDMETVLYSLLAKARARATQWDMLMELLKNLHTKHIELSKETWTVLLDQASQSRQFPIADWIWAKHVDPMFIPLPAPEHCKWMIRMALDHNRLETAEKILCALKLIDPEGGKQYDEVVKAGFDKARRLRTESHQSKSMHAIFADHSGVLVDAKAALDTPPLQRYLNPAYKQRKERLEKSITQPDDAQ
jgi:hypothetical protein